jgi:hypothetical protein
LAASLVCLRSSATTHDGRRAVTFHIVYPSRTVSDDPESDAQYPVRSFDKHRIEALIDGIFAVALTLLVLDIKLPEDVLYASNEALWQRLLGL